MEILAIKEIPVVWDSQTKTLSAVDWMQSGDVARCIELISSSASGFTFDNGQKVRVSEPALSKILETAKVCLLQQHELPAIRERAITKAQKFKLSRKWEKKYLESQDKTTFLGAYDTINSVDIDISIALSLGAYLGNGPERHEVFESLKKNIASTLENDKWADILTRDVQKRFCWLSNKIPDFDRESRVW